MRSITTVWSTIALIAASAAPAQDEVRPEPPNIEQSRVKRASETLSLPFVDPGNEKAKRFATATGVSLGEATSQLRRQWALNQFIQRLNQRNPDLFSFVALRNGQLTIGLTDPSTDIAALIPPGLGDVAKTGARYSERGTRAKLRQLNAELRSAGVRDVSVGVNSETGHIEFLTMKSAAELRAAIDSGKVSVGALGTGVDILVYY